MRGRLSSQAISNRGSHSPLGDLTTVIQCPICGTRIMGVGEEKLSANLLDHMTEVHEINPMWEEGRVPLSAPRVPERSAETPQVSSGIGIRCPLCGEKLVAEDDEGLSSELSDHMLNDHEVIRRLTGWSSAR